MYKALGFIWPSPLTNHISNQYGTLFSSAHKILVNRAPESHFASVANVKEYEVAECLPKVFG